MFSFLLLGTWEELILLPVIGYHFAGFGVNQDNRATGELAHFTSLAERLSGFWGFSLPFLIPIIADLSRVSRGFEKFFAPLGIFTDPLHSGSNPAR